MKTPYQSFFARTERYCEERGISPATLCGQAKNNARLFARLKRRAEKLQEDVEAIERFMADRAPAPSGEAS